jgi:membrane protease YdiL (CAAX protease family)
VFAAVVPVTLLTGVLVGIPLDLLGADLTGPVGQLAGITVQALVYVALIRLLVVDTGALSWAAMGLRGPAGRVAPDLVAGALWAVPVIIVTAFLAIVLAQFVPELPESPLPPTGETVGFALQLLAGAIIAPFGEELLFRGLATTAWVRDLGVTRGILRAAVLFAFAHVIGITGTTAGGAFALAAVAFLGRVPVALALGWLFVRRGSLWASFGLHATYNAILLTLAELAIRAGPPG